MSTKKEIKLDNKWVIVGTEYNWELIKEVEKERKKLGEDKKPTGEIETYLDEEKWYFPKIKMCLSKYVEESLKQTDTLEEILLKLTSIEKMINNM